MATLSRFIGTIEQIFDWYNLVSGEKIKISAILSSSRWAGCSRRATAGSIFVSMPAADSTNGTASEKLADEPFQAAAGRVIDAYARL